MSHWPSVKAQRLLPTLLRLGWPDFAFAFHDGEEVGPRMLARIAKQTGLSKDDL
jgi:predicted RNA binding protein YcfA (HicA-like mRNA interferase family)